MISKYWSACWAEYTPYLLSCVCSRPGLLLPLPLLVASPPTCQPYFPLPVCLFNLSLGPWGLLSSLLSQISLKSFPKHFDLTLSCLTLSCCWSTPLLTVLNLLPCHCACTSYTMHRPALPKYFMLWTQCTRCSKPFPVSLG